MRGDIARGAAWMVLFRLLDRAVGVLSTVVLARLLVPADFGLVAMAMSVIAVIELATNFSFEMALIQKADPQREHYDTAWTLNILLSLSGALITALLAWPAASFYGDDRLIPVMLAVASLWLVTGFENIAMVNFRRELDFAGEFRVMATKRLMAFAVTMAAAWTLQSYWALIIGTATGRLTGVALSYLWQSYRPRFSLAATRELFSFSGWLLLNNIMGVLLGKVPHFVVGRVLGAPVLGAYTIGAEIAALAHTELVAPINRAMFPGYARLAQDPPAFRRTCLEATAGILLIVLPVCMGIAVLAAPVVRLLLGDQWAQAVPVIQVLAFAGAVTAITSNNVAAYIALGRPHLTTWILLSRVGVLALLLVLFVREHGLLAVAGAELGAALVSLLVSLPLLMRTLDLHLKDYLAHLWRPVLATAGMGAVVHAVSTAATASLDAGLARSSAQLLIGVPVGVLCYPVLLASLWWLGGRPEGVEVMLLRRAWAWWQARRQAAADAR